MATSKTKDQTPKPGNHQLPEGVKSANDDIVGTWNFEDGGMLVGIPRHVKLSDSGIDKRRTSALIFVELTAALEVRERPTDAQEEGAVVKAEPGDIVGVWYKAGMRKIRNLANVEVHMFWTGEKDVGRPSPMKTFEVGSTQRGHRLRIDEDNRKESAESTPFDEPGVKRPMQQQDMTVPRDADGNAMF